MGEREGAITFAERAEQASPPPVDPLRLLAQLIVRKLWASLKSENASSSDSQLRGLSFGEEGG